MKLRQAEAEKAGNQHFSHFGPENNLFAELEQLFRTYGEAGTGQHRKYLHNAEEAAPYKQEPGHVHALGDAAGARPTCCSTRACMAPSSRPRSTSRATPTC